MSNIEYCFQYVKDIVMYASKDQIDQEFRYFSVPLASFNREFSQRLSGRGGDNTGNELWFC
jgi:hypothetical protein